MKINCDRAALADAARWVARAIMRVPFSPIMAGMVVSADDGRVTLRASDFDTSLQASVDAEISEPGEVLVPGHALTGYVSAARGSSLGLAESDGALVATVGRSRASYRTLPLAEYPQPMADHDQQQVTVDAGHFDDLVRALLAHSDNDAKPVWQQGVKIDSIGGNLVVSAGTRYALGMTNMDAEGEVSILVLADHLANVIAGLTGDLIIRSNAEHGPVTFATPSRTAQLRQLDEHYPDLDRLFAEQRSGAVKINRDALTAAVRLASTGTDRVILKIEGNLLSILSHTPEKGELAGVIEDEVECEANHDREFCLNSGYLGNALAGLSGEEIMIVYPTGAKKGSVVLSDGSATRHLIATIRVGED